MLKPTANVKLHDFSKKRYKLCFYLIAELNIISDLLHLCL